MSAYIKKVRNELNFTQAWKETEIGLSYKDTPLSLKEIYSTHMIVSAYLEEFI